jgi:F0F1-type ATP synthase membrane subunit c/vacuolar-type H+-ATPase subunit K
MALDAYRNPTTSKVAMFAFAKRSLACGTIAFCESNPQKYLLTNSARNPEIRYLFLVIIFFIEVVSINVLYGHGILSTVRC